MTDEKQEEKPESSEVNEGRPWIGIFMNNDGTLKITGHINNKIVAYGLLGAAKDSISNHIEKQVRIERVNNGSIIQNLRNGFNGFKK